MPSHSRVLFGVSAGLILLAGAVLAENPPAEPAKAPNLNPDAVGKRGPVATEAMAQEFYALGMAQKDPLLVLAAAKLAASVDARDVERKKETTGEAKPDQPEGASGPADAAKMLADAQALAAEDEVLVGLVEDVTAEGARGRVGGVSKTSSTLPAGQADVWELPFYGDSYAELAVIGDGDANLDVVVLDENGNTICYDAGWSDKIYCDFAPSWNGYFYLTVKNNGDAQNSYYVLTN